MDGRAPAGGITIAGRYYAGGRYIPPEILANATDAERAAVASGDARGKPLPPFGGVTAPKLPTGELPMFPQDMYGRPMAPPASYDETKRSEGEVWQGPSGKWFTKKNNRVVPTKAPGGGASAPAQPAAPQPTASTAPQQTAPQPQQTAPVAPQSAPGGPAAGPGGVPRPPAKSAKQIQAELMNAPFEVSRGLSPADAQLERESQAYVRANYPAIRDSYLQARDDDGKLINAAFNPDGSVKHITLNTDEWRPFIPGYVGTNAGAVHEAASWLNKMMAAEAYENMRGKGNGKLMILAGGGGSGKGTATKDFFTQTDYPLALDQVSDNLKKLEAKMDEAAANGFTPEYVFIDRPPDAAAGGIVGRALGLRKRGQLARTVNIEHGLRANIDARKTAIELLKKRPDVVPQIVDNTGRMKRRLITDRAEAIQYLEGRVREDEQQLASGLGQKLRADIVARTHAGEIPHDLATGFLGPGWDNPNHDPNAEPAGHHHSPAAGFPPSPPH